MKNVAALTLLMTALTLPAFPQDGAAWFTRGNSLHKENKAPEARDAYQHAIDLRYRPAYAMAMIARSYLVAGDTPHATEWLNKAATAGFAAYGLLDVDPDFAAAKAQVWFQKAHAQMELNAKPCMTGAQYKQFDFWLGEWDVEVAGKITARSRIEKIADGCVVQENWMPFNSVEGKSWNFYNAATKKWEQIWMSAGAVLKLEGEVRDGAMYYTGTTPQSSGPPLSERLTFTPMTEKRVHQFWEQSRDAGKTWTVAFDGIYIPRK